MSNKVERGKVMLIPLIKVKDKRGNEHIVGTNTHDELYIDEKNGGIHYLDLQCCGSTEGEDSQYKFMSREPEEYDFHPVIQYVTVEELVQIAIENMHEQIEAKIELDKMLTKFVEEQLKCEEKLKNALPDTSGMIF